MIAAFVAITRFTSHLAKAFLLLLVLLQFAVVIMRYVFGVNFLWVQEAVLAAHGAIFMLAAGWTLVVGKHVAIDVFTARASDRRRKIIAKVGFVFLLLPMMAAIIITSASYVGESWRVLEGSQEVSGLPGVFILKSLVPVFAVLMIVAGVATFLRKTATDLT